MNFIQIAGHLGADPETRVTQTGKKVTTLRVAARARKGQQDDTIWWRVTIWDDNFKNMIPHLKKGSPVIVFGEMKKPEIYMDREGKPQVSLDVTAVDLQFSPFGKPGAPGAPQEPRAHQEAAPQQHAATSPYGGYSAAPQGKTFDDEVPF